MSRSASLAPARVMAHCGGSPAEAVSYAAGAITENPADHEPHDVTLRAAAYRVRATGSAADLDLLLQLAPQLPHAGYRDGLLEHALGRADLPPDRAAAARGLQTDE